MTALAGYTADGRETGHRRWCERLVHLRGQVFASRLRELVAAANERHEGPTWKYLIGMALLPDYLQDALDAFGRSCEDYELGEE